MLSTNSLPTSCFILVIGGGPGGSYAASCLAREGLQVVLLETEKFPRYHVGESMLPSMRHFLRFIGLEDKFDEFGFTRKVGAAFKLNPHKREGYTNFVSEDEGNYTWNVIRSECDALMLEHAKSSGTSVYDGTKVTEIQFDGVGTRRPVSASWKDTDGNSGKIAFKWLIDASGRNGVLSRYTKNRKINQSLKNIAFWGYWRGTGSYNNGIATIGPPFFEALTDESGWAWFIPLHDGTTSVGVVMDQEISTRKKSNMARGKSSSVDHYLEELVLAPGIARLLAGATLVENGGAPAIRSASDYSYSADSYAGDNYRLVGDAGCFIDPFFSSGVHLALSSALSAAATICAAVRGDCTASEASLWHNTRVGTSYTRFLLVVLSAYRQIRAQQYPVLTDIDEDNFDRAFDNFRPIIQGNSDVHEALSEEEVLRAIDFCTHAFDPAPLEDFHKVSDATPLSEANPALDPDQPNHIGDALAATKLLRAEDMFQIRKFVSDRLHGLSIRLEKGALGLQH